MVLPEPIRNNSQDVPHKFREGLAHLIRPAFYLSQNLISRTGVVLATTSGITLVFTFASLIFGFQPNPYAGIVVFMILPTIFAVGLVLIPIGIWRDYRRKGRAGDLPAIYPKVDFVPPRGAKNRHVCRHHDGH